MEYESSFAKWGSLVVLSLALAIIVIDTTLLNVSLETLIRELHTDIKSIQWVITDYALILAALTITGGRLGDLFGRKKMFILGAVIFAIGSFIASISNDVRTLLLGEAVIEGIGAALMMPATASIVVSNFKGKDRALAFGIWGAIAGASAAVGPILGGYLTTHYSWRWGFRINVGIAALILIGSFLIKESYEKMKKVSIDWLGVFLSAIGLSMIVFGIIESETYGWWTAKEIFSFNNFTVDIWNLSITPIAAAIGLIFVIVFIFWERRVERKGGMPLVSMKLFSNSEFMSGSITTMILTLAMTGMVFILPVFWQSVRGLDAFHTGLAGLPLSLGILVAGPSAALLTRKFSAKSIIQTGLGLAIIAGFVLHYEIAMLANPNDLILGLALYGIGMGFVLSPISNLTLSAVSVQEAGEASGVNNTFRQIGSSFGSAIIGAIMISSIAVFVQNGIADSTVIPQPAKAAIIQNLSNNSANIEFGNSAAQAAGSRLSPSVKNEINNIVKNSITEAGKTTFYYAAIFTFLAFLASLYLPSRLGHEQSAAEQRDAEEDSAAVLS